jgi:enoyl-CoA hydratase/carnithine racemase
LNSVITQIETDPKVRVVVFQSAVPGFFLTHYDFVPPLSATTRILPGATGLPALPDMLVRLSRAPVVSIASIRGRATGVGSELSLASDMRFASREKALLSQWEIGAGLVPGGGPMARLPCLIGRGRALEVLLSGEDIPGDLAERYGYVNRALPDAELDHFVDALARRIARFDKQSIAAIKRLVDITSLPPDSDMGRVLGLGAAPAGPAKHQASDGDGPADQARRRKAPAVLHWHSRPIAPARQSRSDAPRSNTKVAGNPDGFRRFGGRCPRSGS